MTSGKNIAAVDLRHKGADQYAVSEAILWAKTHDAEIELVFVIPDQQQSFPQHYNPQEMRQKVEDEANREIAAFASVVDWDGITHTETVQRGITSERLIAHAAQIFARTIVIGANKPGLKELFMGPNAARVARQQSCNVLVAQP